MIYYQNNIRKIVFSNLIIYSKFYASHKIINLCHLFTYVYLSS